MNYLALAPMKYKRSVVCGMIHRIFRACSNFKTFHESIEKAKVILERNQYPKEFVDKIVEETLNKLVGIQESVDKETTDENDETEKHLFKLQYRGKISDEFRNSLRKINALCQVVFKTKKLKTVLPSLKPSVPTSFKSSLVYKIQCPRCSACYVGYTRRHLISRVKEHGQPRKPVARHMEACNHNLDMDDVSILARSTRTKNVEAHLLTLEALFIAQLKPSINTRDEYKSHELVIKLF